MLNSALNVRHLRREPRMPHDARASLQLDGRSWDVVIINFSKRGICVQAPLGDLTGRIVGIKLHEGGQSLDFRVVWCRSGMAGLQAYSEADSGRVDAFHHALLALKHPARARDGEEALRFGLFIGDCPAMQGIFRRIERAAATTAPVLITGETGTGKDLCAQAIHQASQRSKMPFVPVNCATLAANLSGSDLFGHRRGAFTGANADRVGAVEQADGGTLFFDELGELDLAEQAKLLRFAQSGEFMRLGDERCRISNARIVCATNRNPRAEVGRGRLREDLFYRLHVIPIHLPPLRERKPDILRLARHFLRQYANECGRPGLSFSEAAEDWMLRYVWPGNIRQLSNAIRQCAALIENDTVTRFDIESAASALDDPLAGSIEEASISPADDRIEKLDDVIERVIERAVSKMGGSIPKAAQALGVSSSTIYRHYKDLSARKLRA